MLSEYPSHIGECFFSSLKGAYFKTELNRARADKRIGLPLPFDPSRPVNTFWDIGMDDENCIWFHQTDGVRHRMIDFYRNSGEGLPHHVQVIKVIRARISEYGRCNPAGEDDAEINLPRNAIALHRDRRLFVARNFARDN